VSGATAAPAGDDGSIAASPTRPTRQSRLGAFLDLIPLGLAIVAEAAWISIVGGLIAEYTLQEPSMGIGALAAFVTAGVVAARVLSGPTGDRWPSVALFLVAVGGPHERRVGHTGFHRLAARFDLDFGPAILAVGLDFAVAHIAFEVAFDFNALTDVLVQIVVSVEPVEDRGKSAARPHGARRNFVIVGFENRGIARRIRQQVTGALCATDQTSRQLDLIIAAGCLGRVANRTPEKAKRCHNREKSDSAHL